MKIITITKGVLVAVLGLVLVLEPLPLAFPLPAPPFPPLPSLPLEPPLLGFDGLPPLLPPELLGFDGLPPPLPLALQSLS
mgnify:CR=1 FL=1